MLWINSRAVFKKVRNFILDVFFPINCLGCKAEDVWICNICKEKINIRNEQVCPICEKTTTPDGQTCFACKKKAWLDGMLVAASYRQPLISKTVHLFKYRFVEELSLPLSDVVIKAIRGYEMPLPDLVIPIPLHPKRLRWRGFNQSALLAKNIIEKILPGSELEMAENIMIRSRYTLPQMSIRDHSERNRNIRDAFAVENFSKVKGKRILLVDDIATTGSTISECARVLKAAGAKEVWATVIARQEYKKNPKT